MCRLLNIFVVVRQNRFIHLIFPFHISQLIRVNIAALLIYGCFLLLIFLDLIRFTQLGPVEINAFSTSIESILLIEGINQLLSLALNQLFEYFLKVLVFNCSFLIIIQILINIMDNILLKEIYLELLDTVVKCSFCKIA